MSVMGVPYFWDISSPQDILDVRDGWFVLERGGVPESGSFEQLGQQPAHDLAAAGLRHLRNDDDVARLRDRPDRLRDVRSEFGGDFLAPLRHTRSFLARAMRGYRGNRRRILQHHERDDRVAG